MKTFEYCGLISPWRRIVFFTLVGITTLFALALLTSVYQKEGLNPLEIGLLLLYAVLMLWICLSFWTATLGFIIQWRQSDRFAVHTTAGKAPLPQNGRTALIMPIYNEDPHRVFAGVRAICDDLIATGQHQHFDYYVLSNTLDPELWIEEELRWQQLRQELNETIHVYYRNRLNNSERKVGNIKDFCTRWGGHYRYAIVLDADSLISGTTLVDMVRIMENNPCVGLLQVPPVPIGKESLFARILQFSMNVYGPIFTAGLNFWQLAEGNSWGHNLIFRVRAFTEQCGLPRLPGSEPFGGEILSHDFVEAALLRRGGWEVWLAYDLGGSYEELPPTLIDYAKRDRRWCQGNLQHARLVLARGWHPINRLHLAMGIMSYLASPLWFLFLLLTGVDAYTRAQSEPAYFFGYTLFPVWPESYTVEMITVLLVTLAMLFLPKGLALLLLFRQPETVAYYGGAVKASLSMALETLTSLLIAPILMLFQTKFVMAILLRRSINWSNQRRADHQTGLLEALSTHGGQTLLGIVAVWYSYTYVNDFFWWFIPVALGIVLAVPISILLSSLKLGLQTRHHGLFLIPEEIQPPEVLTRLEYYLQQPDTLPLSPARSRFLQVIVEPSVYALHASLLPEVSYNKRYQHYLQGLVYQLLEEGPNRLTAAEKRALLTDYSTLQTLHGLTWSLPGMSADFGRMPI
ncbi:glucosyl transferase [Thioploca ingrica]|uniref:Glucans biosynthesis glucosyltransferase H n=1 Tax=Thioploca ingrica TaxID=40754 RepID=A0A090AHU2_9GAMM|nr:glucosyl transferase [Thioploca ingrica]